VALGDVQYLPAGQSEHDVELAAEYSEGLVVLQGMGTAVVEGHCEPAGHGVQTLSANKA
jgi:hypothetical protein